MLLPVWLQMMMQPAQITSFTLLNSASAVLAQVRGPCATNGVRLPKCSVDRGVLQYACWAQLRPQRLPCAVVASWPTSRSALFK